MATGMGVSRFWIFNFQSWSFLSFSLSFGTDVFCARIDARHYFYSCCVVAEATVVFDQLQLNKNSTLEPFQLCLELSCFKLNIFFHSKFIIPNSVFHRKIN